MVDLGPFVVESSIWVLVFLYRTESGECHGPALMPPGKMPTAYPGNDSRDASHRSGEPREYPAAAYSFIRNWTGHRADVRVEV